MQKKILIIDDEEAIRKNYRNFFNALSDTLFEIIEASNATEATNHIIRKDLDIIILDIKMPGVNGRVMSEVIKEYNPRLKVIIASVFPIDKQKRIIPDATDYFDKSQGPMKLLEKVAGTLVS